MRSIDSLSARALALYSASKPEELRIVGSEAAYSIAIENVYREFVHACGGVYHVSEQIPLVIGQRDFTLPLDLRSVKSIRVGYIPRTISSVSLVSGTQTITTTTAHELSIGQHIQLTGMKPTYLNSTDAAVTNVSSAYIFDVACVGADTTYTEGSVTGVLCSRELEYVDQMDIEILPHYEDTNDATYSYWYPDPLTISVYPPSDGTYCSLLLEYDAEVPDVLVTTDTLPAPSYLEQPLMCYAASILGEVDIKYGRMMFDDAVKQWISDQAKRVQHTRKVNRW